MLFHNFKEWIIYHQHHLDEEEKLGLDYSIKLEEIIDFEKNPKRLRRSKRIALKLKEKEINDAYQAYLSSFVTTN